MLVATASLAKLPVGSHCRHDVQCVSGHCEQGACQSQQRKFSAGAPCRQNVQCESGICSGRRGLRICR